VIFCRAHALLHLINFEDPFGLSVVEAMACGTPVIATRRGSMSEIIKHGRTRFIVDSLQQAAAAVEAVAGIDRHWWPAFGTGGPKAAFRRLNLSRFFSPLVFWTSRKAAQTDLAINNRTCRSTVRFQTIVSGENFYRNHLSLAKLDKASC
jgi:glycosyltransferase involved in cell wall biosynthesis